MKTLSISELFDVVQVAVFNLSENEDLQKKMNGYGFTSKRVQEGHTLLDNALQMDSTQEQHYDLARRMSLQIEQDSDATIDIFKSHIAIAKAAFRKEPHLLKELKIKKLATGRWALTKQAIGFYHKASQFMEQLRPYGATEESFQQNKAAAEALVELQARRLKKKGDAEDSTQLKTQTINELRAWYGEFRKLARIAFKDRPQVLETFGMVVPSSRKKHRETEQS